MVDLVRRSGLWGGGAEMRWLDEVYIQQVSHRRETTNEPGEPLTLASKPS